MEVIRTRVEVLGGSVANAPRHRSHPLNAPMSSDRSCEVYILSKKVTVGRDEKNVNLKRNTLNLLLTKKSLLSIKSYFKLPFEDYLPLKYCGIVNW